MADDREDIDSALASLRAHLESQGKTSEEAKYISTELFDFATHMPPGDDLELIVLKGHLLIERKLEQIIMKIVAHGDIIATLDLKCFHKIKLAQSMCWSHYQHPFWEFMLKLNSLRNNYSHSLGDAKTQGKLDAALQAHQATLTPDEVDDVSAMSTADKLRHGTIQTIGFLGRYLTDAIAYRMITDELHAALARLGPSQA